MDQETQTAAFELTQTETTTDRPLSTWTQELVLEESLEERATKTPSISGSVGPHSRTGSGIPFLIIGIGILGLAVVVLIIYWFRDSLKEN